jgi:hypothetical protein
VVLRNCVDVFAAVGTEHCATVADVGDVADFVNDEEDERTAAAAFEGGLGLGEGEELLLGLAEAELESLDGFVREVRVFSDLRGGGSTYLCMFSLRKSEHLLPPWPSKTPK